MSGIDIVYGDPTAFIDTDANFLSRLLLIDPHFAGVLGLSLCIGLSVVGSAWYFYFSALPSSVLYWLLGIWTIGGGVLGASIARGKLETRNLVSILFCEALSIYGIIVSIIIATKVQAVTHSPPSVLDYQCGYQMLGAGLIVGLANLAAGTTLGVIGKGIAVSTTAEPNLFVKLLIVLIFGEVLGLYGMIISLIMVGNVEFGKP